MQRGKPVYGLARTGESSPKKETDHVSLAQCLSNCNVHTMYLGIFLKYRAIQEDSAFLIKFQGVPRFLRTLVGRAGG